MQPGAFVVCPKGRAFGVDVTYFTAEREGIVLGLSPDGNIRVDWEGDELRHAAAELVEVQAPVTSDAWVLRQARQGGTCVGCGKPMSDGANVDFAIANMHDDCYEESIRAATDPNYLEPCEDCGGKDGQHSHDCYHTDCDEDDWAVHGCGPSQAMIRALGDCGQCGKLIPVWNERLREPDAETCICPD